jgi:hypothetical protein
MVIGAKFGKIFVGRAERSHGTERHRYALRAIDLLREAELVLKDVWHEHVTVNYVRFFLWKAYCLAEHFPEANQYKELAKACFIHARFVGMCHYDDARSRSELGIA